MKSKVIQNRYILHLGFLSFLFSPCIYIYIYIYYIYIYIYAKHRSYWFIHLTFPAMYIHRHMQTWTHSHAITNIWHIFTHTYMYINTYVPHPELLKHLFIHRQAWIVLAHSQSAMYPSCIYATCDGTIYSNFIKDVDVSCLLVSIVNVQWK